jgi:hypothetical protein
MSDWAVGDLAVCVDDKPRWHGNVVPVAVGCIYRVNFVEVIGRSLFLTLDGVHPSTIFGSYADRFRKIRPDEREACEPEFVTLLKRSKHKVSDS